MNLIGRKKYLNLHSYDVKYLNLNKDPILRKEVTDFFKNKIIKWIKHNDDFKHLKNKLSIIDNKLISNLRTNENAMLRNLNYFTVAD